MITIAAVLNLFTGIGWLTTLVLPIILYYILLSKPFQDSYNCMDFLWLLMLVWMVSTWIYNDYPNKGILSLRCIIGQIGYMMAYWIARKSKLNYNTLIIQKSYFPLTIVCIIGIYCFFMKPEWYTHLIQQSLNNRDVRITESIILEANRLRSIFSHPYILAYFCAFTIIYESFCLINKKLDNIRTHYVFIGLIFVTSLLAMQRGPLVCALMGVFISIYYAQHYHDGKRNSLAKVVVLTSVALLMGSFVIENMDDATNDFFLAKVTSVTDSSDDFVSSRFYLNQRDEAGLLGDGVGRHDIMADKYNPGTSMRDGEYMKILQEQGYIGMAIFSVFCLCALKKCITHFKHLNLEFCLLLMLIFCMIGANPLSTSDKHPIIYWLAFGQISKFKT